VDLVRLLDLASHGPDTYVGSGPRYHWGGLYGGQIVAQAMRAAANTVDAGFDLHSVRAYFIRPGDDAQPIQFDVERLRNGRGFATRRVLARQADGAILNLDASFQRPQSGPDIDAVLMPDVPGPSELTADPWTPLFERATVPRRSHPRDGRSGLGRQIYWMRAAVALGDDQLAHRAATAYMSDDLPVDCVVRSHPGAVPGLDPDDPGWFEEFKKGWFSASLDHAMWFHRPVRADEWMLFDVSCLTYTGGRGLTFGHVFLADGTHVATVAQEALVRERE